MNTVDPRYYGRLVEVKMQQEGSQPFFCLSLLYKQLWPEMTEMGEVSEEDRIMWKGYWYGLN